MRRRTGSVTRMAVLLAAALLHGPILHPSVSLRAQASAYVPGLDPVYRELDALTSAGLLPEVIVGQRPYSRTAFARMTARAREALEDIPASRAPARVREALARLERRFARELEDLCEADDEGCPAVGPAARVTGVRMDGTWAESPWRGIPTSYGPTSGIDGRLNPLLTGEQGRELLDGWTGGLEAAAEVRPGRHLAGYVRPRAFVGAPRGGSSDADVELREGYARAVLGNLSVDVGRSHVFLGQGLAAGVMASHNPRAFDMVRLTADRPFRLPWIFDGLGPADVAFLAAHMGSDRDIPDSKLFLTKLSVRPHPRLELGASILNQQMGEGAPDASVVDRIRDILLPGLPPLEFSEKVAAVEGRLTLPDPGLDLYFEWATTDVNFYRIGEMLTDEAAWVVGGRLARLGEEGRGSVRVEWHRTGVRPYTHHQYTSGLTLDGLVIGHPGGPMMSGLSARFEWTGTGHLLALSGAWERYSGDAYRSNGEPGGDLRFNRVADNPDEIRMRVLGEWSLDGAGGGLEPSVRLGWERVERFAFTAEDRTNLLARIRVSHRW